MKLHQANRSILLSIISVFIGLTSFGQLAGFSAPLFSDDETKKLAALDTGLWSEAISMRSIFSTSFTNSKGDTKSIFSKKPINYIGKDGLLTPISPLLIKDNESGNWVAAQQPYPTKLFTNGSYAISSSDGQEIHVADKVWINGVLSSGNLTVANNKAQLIYNDQLRKEVSFFENAIKSNYILQSSPQGLGENLIIEEKIELPKGYTLSMQEESVALSNGYFQGDILINNQNGLATGKIFIPFYYDANKSSLLGSHKIIQKADGSTAIQLAIPTSWLNDPTRNYPVVIDPLVAGPMANWGGGYMPSCFMPSYNMDSVLVTIPAGISVSGLYVSASFYADPFTPATMSNGAMYFSTVCGNSQTFTVTGATANFAGTAYLDSFNMMAPLTCCYPESCSPTNIYVRMHLGRNAWGAGCNQNYIRYDPFSTLWPFQVIVYGKTPESYGNQWFTPQTPFCTNKCTVNATAYARYGVAPYTFSHPWTTQVVTLGTNNGCSSGATSHQFVLTIPNCPDYCDSNNTVLTIPPPVIVDACGTVVSGIPAETVPLIPATNVDLVYDSIICSGTPYTVSLTSCLPGGTVYYWGNNQSGQGSFSDLQTTTTTPLMFSYSAYATLDNCTSDTTNFNVYIQPNPIANYSIDPTSIIVEIPVMFLDESTAPASNIVSWNWYLNDTLASFLQDWGQTFNTPGSHPLCLIIQDNFGCVDSLCTIIQAIPAEVHVPNVITPNNDGLNEFLSFEFLEFYPDNQLLLFNRWGNLIYEKTGYQNDWTGDGFTDGTYFFMLRIEEKDLNYSGFFEILR